MDHKMSDLTGTSSTMRLVEQTTFNLVKSPRSGGGNHKSRGKNHRSGAEARRSGGCGLSIVGDRNEGDNGDCRGVAAVTMDVQMRKWWQWRVIDNRKKKL
ncbi:unnamed protein product [Lactuca virosa]|uniref:Uncharacterized protein n=1 Tax=Lactuca virosa TaxID=75947 RepID=A0AAU9P6X5_9ASTR|nr:unnamed protein product [Lactuca virosa]